MILEELDEFWDEVRKKSSKRLPEDSLHELAQVAALCEKVAYDLGLLARVPVQQVSKRPSTGDLLEHIVRHGTKAGKKGEKSNS